MDQQESDYFDSLRSGDLLEKEDGESEMDFKERKGAYVKAVEADKVRTEEAVRDAFDSYHVNLPIASGHHERVYSTKEEQEAAQKALEAAMAATPSPDGDRRLESDWPNSDLYSSTTPNETPQEPEKPPSKLGKVWNAIKMIATFWILGRFGNKRNNYNRRDGEYYKEEQQSGLEQLLSALGGNPENPPPFPA